MKLTLLVRAYCHLCDEMRAGLAPLLASGGATVELIDVDTDAALASRWGDKVPVLLEGGQELCHHRLDATALARWMREATSR